MTAQQHGRDILGARWLPSTATWGEYRTFLATALRHPTMTGAATPTSGAVAATVAQVVPTTGAPVVVELGPGTGSLSSAIHRRLPREARHIGVELGAELVEHLHRHQPWMETVHADARDLTALLAERDITRVDAVISSIPWSVVDEAAQDSILSQARAALAPHGAFTAMTYLPRQYSAGGRRFRERLEATFDEVLTHTTWLNVPPVLHYICRRPVE